MRLGHFCDAAAGTAVRSAFLTAPEHRPIFETNEYEQLDEQGSGISKLGAWELFPRFEHYQVPHMGGALPRVLPADGGRHAVAFSD